MRGLGARRRRGFTLVEMMVVVAIVAILATIATATYPTLQVNIRIARAARVFAGLVREARGRALANRTYVRVRVDATGNFNLSEGRCNFGATSSTCACAAGGDCTTVQRTYAMGRGDFRSVTMVPVNASITFDPWGVYQEATSRLFVFSGTAPGANARSITLYATGTLETL